ncbi:MAG: acyl-CoA carboxylase subunit beta [Euryarchaeota archaeon]|nr:acyl-CoA carboxylase subunit beta [Euryarchaeota archaeon]
MKGEAEKLARTRETVRQMGGPERVRKQHERQKLTVRERLGLLFDPGTFVETGILGSEHGSKERVPGDAVVTGYGRIEGRWAGVAAYDFTVKGGSMGVVSETKVARIRQMALQHKFPLVWLIDSGGARISTGPGGFGGEASVRFADSGYLFKEESLMSGVIPLVAAMMGPGFAGTAYIPGLSDFVPMVKGRCSMGLGGPALVKMVTGEDISEEDLGGSRVHCEVSGCGDLEVPSDEECIRVVRDYLSYFPSSNEEKPPRRPWSGDPAALMDDAILNVIPDSPRQAYDMHKLIALLVDEGRTLEMKPKWGRNIITSLGRIAGYPVGVIGNNPMFYAGAIDINAADKAARFIWLCDAFNIPLLFLSDVPGFMVGSKAEKDGIIRHGAKMVHAVAEATVPKLTVVVRKSYGAGYYAMCGRAFDPDLLLAWPGAEISVMGPEGMVSIFARDKLKEAPSKEEQAKMVTQLADNIRPHIQVEKTAAEAYVDDVIDPRETRPRLIAALEYTRNKRVVRHPRKHGVYPV